jgi:hypothetical protein
MSGAEAADDAGVVAGMADLVMVPPDDQTAARLALSAGESLTPESLEEFVDGLPPRPRNSRTWDPSCRSSCSMRG